MTSNGGQFLRNEANDLQVCAAIEAQKRVAGESRTKYVATAADRYSGRTSAFGLA
jgi:hypothetical protein